MANGAADPRERVVLSLARQARLKADALIVIGLLPGGRFFWDCDDRISIPDLHGLLRGIADDVCANVAATRQAKRDGGKR